MLISKKDLIHFIPFIRNPRDLLERAQAQHVARVLSLRDSQLQMRECVAQFKGYFSTQKG